ncbi:hypothetical protein [Planctomycetes bacterium K23_9]|uniref:Uncharacterized protein n=1 Tax=Stieleria marina TaxID=1930275 RepID=A0A517P2C0_9BACT|nr:hypothetical protein K239x_55400 [Planctomycetes bacterium K23_9]
MTLFKMNHPKSNSHQSTRRDKTVDSVFARRSFLAIAAAASVASCAGRQSVIAASSGEAVRVQCDPSHAVMRVRIEMDVKGNVNVPGDPLVSRKSQVTLPIQSEAVLDYEERYRRPIGAVAGSPITAIERYYHDAHSASRLNRTQSTIQLRESVRQTQVRRDSLPEVVYSVEDYFTNEELSLLRVPVASSALDRMLPTEPVRQGDKYQPDKEALTSILNLTAVEATDVVVEVVEIDADSVKFQLKGKVEGSVEGVPTSIKTVGKLTFDRTQGVCSWLAMAVHETREVGKAEPGFDVAATIKMIRQPMAKPVALPAKPATIDIEGAVPQDRLYVDLQSKRVGVSTVMDRRWRMMSDLNGNAMMRMIENDRSIAQCNLRPLAKLKSGQQWTLEAFQEDVQRTLGDDLNDLIEADQRVSSAGLRVLRVTAHGQVQGVPIQWILMHFSDDDGRRVLATFTMSGDSIDAFAGADMQLADSLSFLEQKSSTGDDAADENAAASEVASKSTFVGDEEVDSASDIR